MNQLPPGKTCRDCARFGACSWERLTLTGDQTECDWSPSRFRQKPEVLTVQINGEDYRVSPQASEWMRERETVEVPAGAVIERCRDGATFAVGYEDWNGKVLRRYPERPTKRESPYIRVLTRAPECTECEATDSVYRDDDGRYRCTPCSWRLGANEGAEVQAQLRRG